MFISFYYLKNHKLSFIVAIKLCEVSQKEWGKYSICNMFKKVMKNI